jgi:hypothetical protein
VLRENDNDLCVANTRISCAQAFQRLPFTCVSVVIAFTSQLRLGLEDKCYAVEIDKYSIREGGRW